jgi:hypothetical protein
LKYLVVHEQWEFYIYGRPRGLNLHKKDDADALLPIGERERPSHRFAILKELRCAEADGKLDAYMQWWRDYYQADIERIRRLSQEEVDKILVNYGVSDGNREPIIERIRKNMQMREETYQKVLREREKRK